METSGLIIEMADIFLLPAFVTSGSGPSTTMDRESFLKTDCRSIIMEGHLKKKNGDVWGQIYCSVNDDKVPCSKLGHFSVLRSRPIVLKPN